MYLLFQPYYFGEDLAGCIRSLYNGTNLMKSTRMISDREVLGKTRKTSRPPEKALLTGRKGNLTWATHCPVTIQMGRIDSRNKADTKNVD